MPDAHVYSTQITNSGVASAAFDFTATDQLDIFLTASDEGNTGVILQGAVGVTHAPATTGATSAGVAQSASVGVTHALGTSAIRATSVIQGAAVTHTHGLNGRNTRGDHQVQSGAADTIVALLTTDLAAPHRILKNPVGMSHICQGRELTNAGTIEAGEVLSDSALLTSGLGHTTQIESGTVSSASSLVARDLSYVVPIVPIIQGGEFLQQNEIQGEWVAIPIATLQFSDVYDENDILAGTDAHDSVADQTNNRWLRADYGLGETTAIFTFSTGLPEDIDVTSIDTVEATIHGREMGTHDTDPLSFACQIIASDDVTPLTNELTIFTDADAGGTFSPYSVVFTLNATDREAWRDARVYFRWGHSKAGQTDDAVLAVSQLYLHGQYTAGFSDINLSQLNLIQHETVRILQPLTCSDMGGGGSVEAGEALMGRTLVIGDMDNDGTVEAGAVGITHIMSYLITPAVIHNEIEARRIWHDLFLTGRDGLLGVSLIEGDNVIEAQDLFVGSLSQTINFISAGIIDGLHIAVAGSLEQLDEEIQGGDLDQDIVLHIPDFTQGTLIEVGLIFTTYILGALSLDNAPTIESGVLTSEQLMQAAIPDTVGEVQAQAAGVTHALSAASTDATHAIEEPLMLVHHAPSSTALTQDNPIEITAMLVPYDLRTTDLEQDNPIESTLTEQFYSVPGLPLDGQHQLSSGAVVQLQELVALSAANDGEISSDVIHTVHMVAAGQLDGQHLIRGNNIPVPGESLDGQHAVESVVVEQSLDPDRYAVAMVMGA